MQRFVNSQLFLGFWIFARVQAQYYDEIGYLIPFEIPNANRNIPVSNDRNEDVIDINFDEVFKTVVNACKISERAIDQDIENLMKQSLPETRVEKCFVTCWLEHFKVIRKNKFYPAQYIKLSTFEMQWDDPKINVLKEILKECKIMDVCIPDRCALGYRIVKCVHDGAIKRALNPKDL